jgi:hypothetical protein
MPFGWVVAGALALASGASAQAGPDCMIHLSDVAHAPRFSDYPARPVRAGRYAAPDLSSREARRYRTVLREAAAKGPNFAGRYRLVVWGCGAGCADFAIIDAASGRVSFERSLRAIALGQVGEEGTGFDDLGLRSRADSRLLVVLGAPNEDKAREGVAFYEWTGKALKLLRFVPRAKACHVEEG